ncbi:DUF1289 domain-containing protein [Enterovibrio norvegicus]|uniref:DUF1289 domain-containing protein n=1 Tax=Enterovibrio norvegicus TaxID=188144 RepID=UPI000C8154ED|nr:DUF1289 domain-containing protein [Enterovibrio norvegicus]PMN72390.1 DUF1289 domain-containing protein [Enterovibrio norvegicus]
MKRNQSPSTDVCDFSAPKGWCAGCGRTQEECQKWKAMKPYDKNILQKELKKRMSKIRAKSTK